MKTSLKILLLVLIIVIGGAAAIAFINPSQRTSSPGAISPPQKGVESPKVPEFTQKKSFNFDSDQVGAVPSYLTVGKTGQGTRSEWSVKNDPSAPSPPNVLAQTADEGVDFHFPYVLVSEGNHKDLSVSVSFKAVSGKLDRAAGIIFRFVDSSNYYVLRANALENNVILFKYVNGQRLAIATASVPISSGLWYNLRVVAIGDSIRGYLDDKPLIDTKDATYAQGLVGLWTKADSVTYFDDLKVEY